MLKSDLRGIETQIFFKFFICHVIVLKSDLRGIETPEWIWHIRNNGLKSDLRGIETLNLGNGDLFSQQR